MGGIRTGLRNFITVIFLTGLVGCQDGCQSRLSSGTGDSTAVTQAEAQTTSLTGSVVLPVLTGEETQQLRNSSGLVNSKMAHAVTGSVPAAQGTVVEILDADMDSVGTAAVDEYGQFSLDVDPTALLDASGENYTFFLRAIPDGNGDGEITPDDAATLIMTVVSDASEGETELAGFEVDTEETLKTFLNFGGTGINPLTATEESAFPADLNLAYLDEVNAALVATASGRLDETADVSELNGQTMDGALATLLLSFYALGGAEGGTDTPEFFFDLVNYEEGSADAAALQAALSVVDGLSGFDPETIAASGEVLDALDGALDVWAQSEVFLGYLDADTAGMDVFFEAGLAGRTLTEFQAMNASTELFETQLDLWDEIDFATLGGSVDEGALVESFGALLDPDIILAMSADANMAVSLGGFASELFSGSAFDPELIAVMADTFESQADDTEYWASFVSDGTLDEAGMDHVIAFFDSAVASDAFADYFSGNVIYDWDALLGGIDASVDYAAIGVEEFAALSGEIFDQTEMVIDAASCEHFCGGAAPSGCFCDDGCAEFGDCCADKEAVCGENYLEQILAQYGYGTETATEQPSATDPGSGSVEDPAVAEPANGSPETVVQQNGEEEPTPVSEDPPMEESPVVNDDADGDGVADPSDNCPVAANPGQQDIDQDGAGDACDDWDGDGVVDADDNCVIFANVNQADANADGIGDACMDGYDWDNDTVASAIDNCPNAWNPGQEDTLPDPSSPDGVGDVCGDFDSDTVADAYDNCTGYGNTDQADDDNDGIGNACDNDYDPDEDGHPEFDDNCQGVYNPDQQESWFNGVGDACDDFDEDGIIDLYDNCMILANADQADANANGVGDICEGGGATFDPDNDYYQNQWDNCPNMANNGQEDTDEDGIGDACDAS